MNFSVPSKDKSRILDTLGKANKAFQAIYLDRRSRTGARLEELPELLQQPLKFRASLPDRQLGEDTDGKQLGWRS